MTDRLHVTNDRTQWLAAMLLAGMTLAVYLPVTNYDFIWDDEHYVQYNPTLRSVSGLRDIWLDTGATPQYYPLVHTSYWIEYRLWELDPRGYHNTNILLHALAALLLWRVLRRLELPGAWLAAAIFALHPVNVESVAWITERKNLLALPFYLGAALAYLHWMRIPGQAEGRGDPRLYALSLLLFVAALFSKTVACSLPAALLLVLWWKRGRIEARWLAELAPFFAVGLALGLLTVSLERHQVGAVGADWDLSPVDRVLVAGRALWFYAGKLLWPNNLTFFYPRWQIDSGQPLQFLFPLTALAVLVAAWLGRHRYGTGPLVALLIFGGTLVPALGFFDVYPMRFSFVADHFQYLAAPALIALMTAAATVALRKQGPWGLRVGALLGAGLLALLAALNLGQQPQFQNLETLWKTTLQKNPGSWTAAHNLGMDLQEAGRIDEAMALFRRALELRPDHQEASNALALSFASRGQSAEAIAQYQRTLETNPENLTALNNLARTLATDRDPTLRDPTEAERLARKAVALTEERNARALAVLAEAQAELGQLAEAIDSAERALEVAVASRDLALVQEIASRLELFRLLQQSEATP